MASEWLLWSKSDLPLPRSCKGRGPGFKLCAPQIHFLPGASLDGEHRQKRIRSREIDTASIPTVPLQRDNRGGVAKHLGNGAVGEVEGGFVSRNMAAGDSEGAGLTRHGVNGQGSGRGPGFLPVQNNRWTVVCRIAPPLPFDRLPSKGASGHPDR